MFEQTIMMWFLFFLCQCLAGYNAGHRNYGITFVILASSLLIFSTLGGGIIHPQNLLENPDELIAGIFLYFVVGAMWSLAKWYGYVRCIKFKNDAIMKQRQDSITTRGVPQDNTITLVQADGAAVANYPLHPRPIPSEHRMDLLGWIAYWPWSAMGFLIFDVIGKLTNGLFSALSGMYEFVSRKAFED